MTIPQNVECLGFTIPFGNLSTNSVYTHWDFGVGNLSTDTSNVWAPSYTFPGPGSYTLVLAVSSGPNCNASDTATITVNEPLVLSFAHNDSLCINGGIYYFDGTVSGPPAANYQWSFGQNGIPYTSNNIDEFNVTFTQPGYQNITLYGSFDNCIDSVQDQVYVYFEPTIDFVFVPTLQCVPFAGVFINTSTSDGPAIYEWDYGDGGTSNGLNGSHLYTQVGNYSVGLTMTTLEGCIDTLFVLQQDIINVNPSPIALFTVNPSEIDVCRNKVTFTNQSIGATQYAYVIDHYSYYTEQPNFEYGYLNYGPDYPQLTVTNAFGCKDSLRMSVMVFPFSLYVPNTFIPDNDGKNDVFKAETSFEIIDWDFGVYNRWGNCVFKTEKFEEGWNGTLDGIPCQDGVYTYKIRYRSCYHPSAWQMVSGSVRLLR
jgi:gliding motility-associated-like protein